MELPNDTRIAGDKTVADWNALKAEYSREKTEKFWRIAFTDFFKQRVETRYFAPIDCLSSQGSGTGEGFSIVAIQCTLIEFLGSTIEGKNYRFRKKQAPPLDKDTEYDNSSDIFVRFLELKMPFSDLFRQEGSAIDFYKSVRCGLLHEARTKDLWTIVARRDSRTAVDTVNKVIDRDLFQECFNTFLRDYEEQILLRSDLQNALLRKLDGFCRR